MLPRFVVVTEVLVAIVVVETEARGSSPRHQVQAIAHIQPIAPWVD